MIEWEIYYNGRYDTPTIKVGEGEFYQLTGRYKFVNTGMYVELAYNKGIFFKKRATKWAYEGNLHIYKIETFQCGVTK